MGPGSPATPEPGEPAATAIAPAEALGWEALEELTGGIAPEVVPALVAARPLEQVYPLLHALAGTGPRDFLVRAAALEALVDANRAVLSHADLRETLYWLDEPARERTLSALRRSGWIQFEPSEGTSLTDLGRWAYDVLSFLHRRLGESELLPAVAGIDYALDIGLDPLRQLFSMRARLIALREKMDAARQTHSEVVLRDAAHELGQSLELSESIRQVLDRVPLDNRPARAIAREVHDLLSRLHLVAAELHSAITEVGRQYLRLTVGLTVEQIVRALRRCSQEGLAEVGREALFPVHVPPPLVTTEVLGSAAEWHFSRERAVREPVRWDDPPAPETGQEAMLVPSEVEDFLAELEKVAAATRAVPLREIIPRSDRATSFLRASLLPLAGDTGAGAGIAGRLGQMAVEVRTEGDGWPEDLAGPSQEPVPLSRLTPGAVIRRGAKP